MSDSSHTDGYAEVGVYPVSLDGQSHGRQLELLDFVNAGYDQGSASDDHGWRAVHQSGNDQGLVGADDLNFHVETHLEAFEAAL